tara:strand:- start:7268 stop:9010 length:1743 start_codon:yes stop_codon:yes gene_type:complete
MGYCCKSTKKDKQCVRKSDRKLFKLPRRFSKKRCMKKISGFTMRSSCAPYKDCFKKRTKRGGSRRLTYKKNILGKPIKKCSVRTGFYRDGFCMTGPEDLGTHTVCAKMSKRFLDFTAKQGNDLSSVVKPSDKWCLCENRWLEAYKQGYAPKVIKSATNMRTKAKIRKLINKQKGGNPKSKKIAYFAGGCFWGLESKFKKVDGVLNTEVGYMGGKSSKSKYTKKKVTYEEVCSGKTGHAETVKVIYGPKISFNQLVELFFSFHDPTTRNKQGPDIGTQYRSIAFYSTKQEKDIIKQYIQQSPKHIVTEVKKKTTFHKAEEYHQNYNEKQQCARPKTEDESVFRKICQNNSQLAEPKFTGIYTKDPYVDGTAKGIYRCPCCDNPLYSSRDAFDSNTGWPAFSDTIDKKGLSISKHINYNKETKELTCKGCGLHLGHRTIKNKKIHDCVNSACLHFVPLKGGSKKNKKKTKKKQFLFNPDSPKKSFDVYIDKNPKDTIPIKYTTVKDVKDTIKKLERLYKQGKYDHKRIWQVGMIMYVRLKVLKKKKKQQYNLAKKYFEFLGKRTDIKNEKERKKFIFNIKKI